jgi:hypothetical protein
MPTTIEKMASDEFWIGGDLVTHTPTLLTSWSTHVKSWVDATGFPLLVVKYEDLLSDPLIELKKIVEFLELKYDSKRGRRAVEAAKLSRLSKQEDEEGFSEYKKEQIGRFFNAGGSRWKEELGPVFINQIESDHQEMMLKFGYLEGQ